MGQFDDIIQAGNSARGPIVPPGAVAPAGFALDSPVVLRKTVKPKTVKQRINISTGVEPGVIESAGSGEVTDNGGPANAATVPGVAVAATKRKRDLNTAAEGARYREKTRARSKEQRAGLATTTMRMVNGQAVDMDEVTPRKANPVSNLLSKGPVKSTGVDPEFTPTPVTEPQVSEIINPGKSARDSKSAADAAAEASRQDLLSGENAFNDAQRKSGGSLRSLNGISYDMQEYKAEGMSSPKSSGFDRFRSDLQTAASSADATIPQSPYSKPTLDKDAQGDTRVSSIVPTAPQLEGLGNSGAVENKDVDNYASRGKDKASKLLAEDPDYKAEQARIAAEKEVNTEDSDEDKLLTAQGQDDAKKTRSEKGQRNAKVEEVNSRTIPWDQQDLWDAKGNVKPEYDTPETGTTMVAKKNWNIQPIYKSPEHQAMHEKRKAYSNAVESNIKASLDKHIDTDYSSASESRAAYATLGKKHAKLRADVDKYHPVPEGGYFNENANNDTFSESYEEMPGVKAQPTPQPENVKDNTGVIPERWMNQAGEASAAQLSVDDKAASRNRTAVTRTRQMDYNNIAARPERGRTKEQELVDLSKAAERNQKLEESGKKLQTHSPEVIFRARLAAEAAGVSKSVYNSPTFHQHPEGRSFVRDAYLQDSAQIGDDAESQEKMAKFAGGNANEANDRKEAAYSFLQNRERFNNSKEPGTGYRYNAGLGNLDIKSDSFRASNGAIVPMSQTEHPEHPGFDLEGSHVGFKGSVPNGTNADGTPSYRPLTHPQTGEDLHEGWHPYKVNGKRVFENHSIPENAIHHADIVEQAIQNGEPPSATLRKLEQGKESAITANGIAINLQPSAPIKGAGGFEAKPLPAGPDLSNVPMSEGTPLPKPDLDMETSWSYRRGLAHKKHEDAGTIVHGCRACSQKASQASRDNAANVAGTFIPPGPRRGVGIVTEAGEQDVRSFTPAEKRGKKAIPTTDDSKSKVFTESGSKVDESSDIIERTKVGPKTPKFELQHGSLEDISSAHAAGHITGDEAYELATNAGHFPGAKPKFTKDEE